MKTWAKTDWAMWGIMWGLWWSIVWFLGCATQTPNQSTITFDDDGDLFIDSDKYLEVEGGDLWLRTPEEYSVTKGWYVDQKGWWRPCEEFQK